MGAIAPQQTSIIYKLCVNYLSYTSMVAASWHTPRAGWSRARFLAWTRDFSRLKKCPHQLWGPHSLLFNGR